MRLFCARISPLLLFASIFGLFVGLVEGVTDICLGAVINSAWVPGSFQAGAATKFLYITFATALYVLFFQSVVAAASVPLIFAKDVAESLRKGILSHWALFFVVLGLAMFASMSDSLFAETDLLPIVTILVIHLVFLALCIYQVRAFFRHVAESNMEDQNLVLRSHGARVGAYILLMFFALLGPDVSTALTSPFARGGLLAVVLCLASPVSVVIGAGMGPLYDRAPENRRLRHPSSILTILAILVPVAVVSTLWRQSAEVNPFLFHSSKKPSAKPVDKPNVIVFMIDKLRADHMSCYGYSRATTPNIDRLASEGVLFRNALSQASWTLPSTATLLSGLHPSVHGARTFSSTLSEEVDTMAEIFGLNGYTAAAYVSNPFLKKAFNLGQGFDEYWDDFISHSYSRRQQERPDPAEDYCGPGKPQAALRQKGL